MKQMQANNARLKKVVAMQMSGRYQQEGAALIAVLLFLILISLAGVMAVKQSSTDLKLATSDQINTLLLQSSDAGQQQLEEIVNGNDSKQPYKDVFSITGVFGYYILNDNSANTEFIYCFNDKAQKYLMKNANVLEPSFDKDGNATKEPDSIFGGKSCDVTKEAGYTSNRQIISTQMSVSPEPVDDSSNEAFPNVALGEDSDSDTSDVRIFDIRSTSTVPSYATSTIVDCFKKTSVKRYTNGETLVECLNSKDSPSKTVFEQASLELKAKTRKCTKFGKDVDPAQLKACGL